MMLPTFTPISALLTLSTSPSISSFLSYTSTTLTIINPSFVNNFLVSIVLTDTGISSTFTFMLHLEADIFPYFKCPPEAFIAVNNNPGALV